MKPLPSGQASGQYVEIPRRFVSLAVIYLHVVFDVPVTCPSLGVCLC